MTYNFYAVSGSNFSKNKYDLERYQKLLDVVTRAYTDLTNGAVSNQQLTTLFTKEIGCITPKVGASVAVFDKSNRLLLVKRTDDNTWCLPCGWVEVN